MQPSLTRDGKPGFMLTQGRPRQLMLCLGQPETAFRVCRVGRVWIGNVRDEYGNVWDASWLPLRIATQRRTTDGESWEVLLDWFASQTVLAQAAALRQVLLARPMPQHPQRPHSPLPPVATPSLLRTSRTSHRAPFRVTTPAVCAVQKQTVSPVAGVLLRCQGGGDGGGASGARGARRA